MDPNKIELILRLIYKAQMGELGLEEIDSNWPVELPTDEFFQRVYDDIESAVEHFPGRIWPGEEPKSFYEQSMEYKALLADEAAIRMFLSGDISAQELLVQRRILLKSS